MQEKAREFSEHAFSLFSLSLSLALSLLEIFENSKKVRAIETSGGGQFEGLRAIALTLTGPIYIHIMIDRFEIKCIVRSSHWTTTDRWGKEGGTLLSKKMSVFFSRSHDFEQEREREKKPSLRSSTTTTT